MGSNLLRVLLILGIFISLTSKGYSQEVLCVHVQENLVHVESGHPELPVDKDEVHFKLSQEVSGKLFKLSFDAGLSYDAGAVRFTCPCSGLLKNTFHHHRQVVSLNPIKTVRLLI